MSSWSLVLVDVFGWDYLGDSVGADLDSPLQLGGLSGVGFEEVVVVRAE